jgi:hypothetical protein
MTENEQKINRCPVCGRLPKIRLGGYGLTEYVYCDVYCKPFLRKAHLGVTHFILPWGIPEMAKERAIQTWNKKVKEVTNNDGE